MKKTLIALAAVMSVSLAVKADYLYWQVSDQALTDNATVEASYLYAKLSNGSYYKLADGTTSGMYEYSGTAHADPSFNYADTTYYVELLSYDQSGYSLAHSGELSYSDLHVASLTDAMKQSTMATWSGVNYTAGAVPEPTSGLMLLVGMAMLGLKRRRA